LDSKDVIIEIEDKRDSEEIKESTSREFDEENCMVSEDINEFLADNYDSN
jgi:hypothetical protein